MKRGLLRGASAATILLSTCLTASQASAQAAAAAAPAAAAGESSTVGEVVVTAERRSQLLEKIPVAVSSFSSKVRDLQGIATVQDLTDVTPGLAYNTLANRPYIRGIGRDTDNLATESGVAVYVDGVYFGANASTILQLDSLFVDRIDVLRGPQSTLYGRNADGGAINYVTRKPPNEFEAEARVGVDNYDKEYGELAVGGPINDAVKFRIGGNYSSQSGGYFHNNSGAPEGGSIAQGGNGYSYHIEGQLDVKFNDNFDGWFKLATSDYDSSFHTQALLGPQDDSEFAVAGGALSPSQFFGLCGLPGGAGGLGCATSPDKIVPGSVVTLPGVTTGNPTANNLRDFDADFLSHSREKNNIIFASTLTYHLPSFDVKYTAGYQKFYYDLTYPYAPGVVTNGGPAVESYQLQGPAGFGNLTIDPAHTEVGFIENESFFSHEFNFTSTTEGPLQWIGGLYWYHEQYDQPVVVTTPDQAQIAAPVNGPPNPSHDTSFTDVKLREDSYAGYGQFDWQMNDQWKFTGGLRFTEDHKYGDEARRLVELGLPIPGLPTAATTGSFTPAIDITSAVTATGQAFPGAGLVTTAANGDAVRSLHAWFNAVTGVARLTWTPDKDDLAYASYSRGYKTGGFNGGQLTANPETQPETVDAFELGYKKVIGRTFQINGALFYYDYQDDQIPLAVQGNAGPPATLVFNIPHVHSYGLELESVWQPIKPLVLTFSYSYLSSTISDVGGSCFENIVDPTGIGQGAKSNAGCAASSIAASKTAGVAIQNLTNETLPQAAPNKVSLNGLYTFNFDPGDLTLSATYIWKDHEFSSIFNTPYNESKSYTQVNLRASWNDASKRYTVFVFADNVFNTVGSDGTGGVLIANSPQIIDRLESLTAPRTYGIEFQYRFR